MWTDTLSAGGVIFGFFIVATMIAAAAALIVEAGFLIERIAGRPTQSPTRVRRAADTGLVIAAVWTALIVATPIGATRATNAAIAVLVIVSAACEILVRRVSRYTPPHCL